MLSQLLTKKLINLQNIVASFFRNQLTATVAERRFYCLTPSRPKVAVFRVFCGFGIVFIHFIHFIQTVGKIFELNGIIWPVDHC